MTTFRTLLAQMRSDERGFSLIELAVAGLIGSVLLVSLGIFTVNTMSTGSFTQGQSETMNDVRNAMGRIEKEIRGADSIVWCGSNGSCLQVGAQTVSGTFRTVRYRYVGTELLRENYNTSESTWGDAAVLIDSLKNTSSQPVFACDTASTLLRVTIDLHVEPTPTSGEYMNVQTSIRPRNFPSVASCP